MQHGVLVPLVEVGEVLPGPNNSIRNNANPTSFQHACSTDKALPIDGPAARYRVLVLMKPWVHAKHDFSWGNGRVRRKSTWTVRKKGGGG
jgi:hypothetical protein